MRKILLTILFIFYFLTFANAQWVQQYFITPYRHLSDVKFANENTGWCSGNQGTILKTTNRGNNWIEQNTNITNKLIRSLYPVNTNIVYAVGHFETILKTTNGGDNWIIIKNGPDGHGHSYEGVFFINENTGWICGSGQLIFKTTNGGQIFDSVNIPVGYNYDIYFRNANEGLVCGEAASMYKTTNGGFIWNEIIVPVGIQAADFFRLSVVNYNIVYTQGVQNNKIYKSTNYGNNWDSIVRVPGADDSNTIFFANENTGWCAGTLGLMFKTTNGGWNWQPEVLPPIPVSNYSGLWFLDENTGWVVGGNTSIIHTSNGGSTYVNNIISNTPGDCDLLQNYPNPFNPISKIKYQIAKTQIKNQKVQLIIYNSLGQEIETLVNQTQEPGTYEVTFDGSQLPSGMYFYKLTTEGFSETKKMVLLK